MARDEGVGKTAAAGTLTPEATVARVARAATSGKPTGAAAAAPAQDEATPDRGFVGRVGPLEIDWPRAAGYYGGIALALAFEAIEPPLALFIAAVPVFKLLKRANASRPERALAEVLEGASKPVGGDASAVIRAARSPGAERAAATAGAVTAGVRGIWADARRLARGQGPATA